MKATITILLTLLSFGYTNAQAPAIQWQKSIGGSVIEEATDIKLTPDGGYVVVGLSNSNDPNVLGNHGAFDYWVVKLDATRTIQWQKSLGGTGNDYAYAIQNTADGGYIIAGFSDSIDGDVVGYHYREDAWVVKLNASGTIQWKKSLGGTNVDFASSIQTTSDGGYIVAGSTSSIDGDVTGNHGSIDCWVVKLDLSGNIQWQKTLGGSGIDYGNAIQTTSDGGYIVAGYSNSTDGDVTGNHGGKDYWVVKLDATGNIQWQKSLGGSGDDEAKSIQPTADGGYVVVGWCHSNDGNVTGNHGLLDYWVVKLNAIGIIQWQKCLGGSDYDEVNSIQTTIDGGYILAGLSISNDGDVTGSHGNGDYWVVKLDATGNIQWQKSMGGTNGESASSIQTTSDGGYIVAGSSSSSNGDVTVNYGNFDYWIVKLGPDLATATFEKPAIIIYPNPVCDVLQIQTPNNTIISKTKIIDITGKVVLEQTQNSNSINVENFSKGTYVLEAYSGADKYTSKFVKE